MNTNSLDNHEYGFILFFKALFHSYQNYNFMSEVNFFDGKEAEDIKNINSANSSIYPIRLV